MNYEEKIIATIPGARAGSCRIGDLDIGYVEAGEGRPVILIHGANIGWAEWHNNIEELSKRFKVYALDLPGAGRSTRINFTEMDPDETLVQPVSEFIKQKGLGPVYLVGHSVGGWVALKMAIDHPEQVSKLLLVNSLGFTDYVPWGYRPVSFYYGAKLLSNTVMSPTLDNMRKFLADVLYNKSVLTDDLAGYYHQAVNADAGSVSHPFMLINRLFKPFKIRDEFVLKNSIHKVKAPTLIIASDKDPLIPLGKQQDSFKAIPHARVDIFKDVGHVPPIEKSREFNELALKFLE